MKGTTESYFFWHKIKLTENLMYFSVKMWDSLDWPVLEVAELFKLQLASWYSSPSLVSFCFGTCSLWDLECEFTNLGFLKAQKTWTKRTLLSTIGNSLICKYMYFLVLVSRFLLNEHNFAIWKKKLLFLFVINPVHLNWLQGSLELFLHLYRSPYMPHYTVFSLAL